MQNQQSNLIAYNTHKSTIIAAMPADGMVKIPAVIKFTAISRSAIYLKIKAGTFPVPVKIGPRSVAWRAAEVRAYVDSLGA